MKISAKGRYALRFMADLALQDPTEFIALKDVSVRQGISVKYLEQIVSALSRAGLCAASAAHREDTALRGGRKNIRLEKFYGPSRGAWLQWLAWRMSQTDVPGTRSAARFGFGKAFMSK